MFSSEFESWVLSASPSSVRLGQGCYADSPEFTGSSAVMEEVASRLTLSADEVGPQGMGVGASRVPGGMAARTPPSWQPLPSKQAAAQDSVAVASYL
jgi:hypothetical protein